MINLSNLVLKGIKTVFAKQLAEQKQAKFESMAYVNTDKTAYTEYLMFDSMPAIYEWIDERSGGKVKDYKVKIENKPYQTKIIENRRTMEYSTENLSANVKNQINGSVNRWNGHLDKLIVAVLEANGTAFDGSTFFGNSHNIDGATAIDNLYPTTGTTLAQVTADYAGALAALAGFVDKNGDPFNDVLTPVVYAPAGMMNTFLTLQNSTAFAAGETNIYAKTFDLVVSPRLEASKWYIYNSSSPVPAMFVQKPIAPNWNVKDDVEDLYVKFLADADFGVGLGNFTSIIKIA